VSQKSLFGIRFDGAMIGSEHNSWTVYWQISTNSPRSFTLHSEHSVKIAGSNHRNWKCTVQSYSAQSVHCGRTGYNVANGVR